MEKPAESGSLIPAAHAFYQWFHGADPTEESLAAIRAFLGSPVSFAKLRQIGTRLRGNEAFVASQAPLIDKWRERMESGKALCEGEAEALIQQLFDSFDHALLFDHEISASSTLVERGRISDSDMRFPGNMPCWTLHLTLRGKALFLSEHMEQEVGPGDMMLLRPDASYHYGLHPKARQWEHLWALFQPRAHWTELLEWTALDDDILYLSAPDNNSLKKIEEAFRQLLALVDHQGPFQNDLQHNKLEEILIRAKESGSQEERHSLDSRIQRACDFMRARMDKKFSIEEVAGACNLSSSRLSHLFKQQMGVGPKTWINNSRLQQARKLLLNSEHSVGTVGGQVGYEDPSHFTRYFKKNMGCSPLQFRQSFKRR